MTKGNVILGSVSSLTLGIFIEILNSLYKWYATSFVDRENHKYDSSYENSLINK